MNLFYTIALFAQIIYVYDVMGNSYILFISVLLTPAYVFINILKRRDYYMSVFKNKFFILLSVLCVCIGLARSNHPTAEMYWSIIKAFQLLCLFLASGIFIESNKNNFNKILSTTLMPFVIICILNVVLWLVNFKPPKMEEAFTSQAVLVSIFGINLDRASFPFGFGINNYSMLTGSLFIISIIALVKLNKNKLLYAISVAFSAISLILIDTRATIISAILLIIFLLFIRKTSKIKFIKFLPYITIVGPLLYVSIIPLLASLDLSSLLVRDNEDMSNGNSRFLIWGIAVQELSNFKLEHLIGYGEYGHYESGASKMWSDIFSVVEKSEIKSPHNTVLSIIFDYGYFGLILYIYFWRDIVNRIKIIWNSNQEIALIFIGFYCYNIIVSISEASFGMYAAQFNYLFFIITHYLYEISNTISNPIRYHSIVKWKNQTLATA